MSQLISTKKSYIDPRDLPSVDRATLRRVFGSLRPYRLRGFVVLGLLVVVAGLGLLPPLLIKQVVDVAIPAHRSVLLVLLCAGMVLGPLLAGLLGVLQKMLTTRTSEQVMLDLRVQLFSHLQAQPLSYFTKVRPGEALSRVLNDVQGAGGALASTLVSVASNLVTLTLALVTVLWLDWRLALLALVLMPVYVIPTRRVGRRRKGAEAVLPGVGGPADRSARRDALDLGRAAGQGVRHRGHRDRPRAGQGAAADGRQRQAGADRPVVHDGPRPSSRAWDRPSSSQPVVSWSCAASWASGPSSPSWR